MIIARCVYAPLGCLLKERGFSVTVFHFLSYGLRLHVSQVGNKVECPALEFRRFDLAESLYPNREVVGRQVDTEEAAAKKPCGNQGI